MEVHTFLSLPEQRSYSNVVASWPLAGFSWHSPLGPYSFKVSLSSQHLSPVSFNLAGSVIGLRVRLALKAVL